MIISSDEGEQGIQQQAFPTKPTQIKTKEEKIDAPKMSKPQVETKLQPFSLQEDDLVDMNKHWVTVGAHNSQTRQLAFNKAYRSEEFWRSKVSTDAADVYKALMPMKIVQGICNQLNKNLNQLLQGKMTEQEIKNKLFKPEQLYEYFGVKILMGYCKMPDVADYFNKAIPYRTRIGDLMKESRFKMIEQYVTFSDELLLTINSHRKVKSEYREKFNYDEEIIPYLMKKVNKIQSISCDAQQSITMVKSPFFESKDIKTGEQISCVYLVDNATQFIISMHFATTGQQDQVIMRALDRVKLRNHKVYLQRNMLNVDQMNHLARASGIYSHGVSKNHKKYAIPPAKITEVQTNGTLYVLQIQNKEPDTLVVSTADGFHRCSANDKRSFATVNLQDNLKRADIYSTLSDQYRCQFSSVNLSGCLFTEFQELIIWNSFIAFKQILKKNTLIEFGEFRLLLSKQLLRSKINALEQAPKQQHQRVYSQMVQTEPQSNQQARQKAPISYFHIPTRLIGLTKQQLNLQCLVCKTPHSSLAQCSQCSEASNKLISLCPNECFMHFHTQPTKYVSNAEDLKGIKFDRPQKINPSAQYEDSTLAKSSTYFQSVQSRFQQSQQLHQPPQQYYQPPQVPYYNPPPPMRQQEEMYVPYQETKRRYSQYLQQREHYQASPDIESPKMKRRPGRPPKQVNLTQRPPSQHQQQEQPKSQGRHSYYDANPPSIPHQNSVLKKFSRYNVNAQADQY